MINPTDIHRHISRKASQFEESVIRRMTQVCLAHNGVNLAQGFPDFPTPPEIKEAAIRAIREDHNQYARTWGAPALVQAVAEKVRRFQGMETDGDTQVTICCGTTEAMIATLLATIDPGDEVVILSPFYENYGADVILCGAAPRYVSLHRTRDEGYQFDPDELASAFSDKTKAIILNTPHNPTGKVFNRDELQLMADLCQRYDALAITDEIYEHIIYDGREHISIATLPEMADRTVTISGLSKTYSVTGWRVAWAIAPPAITVAIRKVHDFLTVSAPHPMQLAGAAALRLPDTFYHQLAMDYARRREIIWTALGEAGFEGVYPEGAYYIMVDIDRFARPIEDDTALAMRLVREAGVATVPGSSFYHPASLGLGQIRICFCKRFETLHDAGRRLLEWSVRQD